MANGLNGESEKIVNQVSNTVMLRISRGMLGILVVMITLAAGGFSAWTSLKSDVAVIGSMIEIIQDGQKDRYYGSQAERDLSFLQDQIDRIMVELTRHENKPWHENAGLKLQELQGKIQDK